MNNTRQERLVGLVRKLLDLSRRNSNPHEAGLALPAYFLAENLP